MTSYVCRIGIWVVFFISSCVCAEPRHVMVEIDGTGQGKREEYCPTLLKMILNASKEPDEVIDITFSDQKLSQARWIAELQKNPTKNQVLWLVTSKEREQLLRPIRVPIYKGLLGLRVLVIRKEDKEKFSKLTRRSDFENLKAGQGLQWIENAILRENGFSVSEGVDTESLYNMLAAGRFDYFPRSIVEVKIEHERIAAHNLIINDSVAFSYPLPAYFFVNKSNTELANRIERGFKVLLKNGEFDKLFFSYPPVIAALDELKRHKLHVIHLTNRFLPEDTPFDHSEYWLDFSQYEK